MILENCFIGKETFYILSVEALFSLPPQVTGLMICGAISIKKEKALFFVKQLQHGA